MIRSVVVVSTVVVCVMSAILFIVWPTIWCGPEKIELARRAQCGGRQRIVYAAVGRYRDEYGKLPASLEDLVKAGYLQEQDIHCPSMPLHVYLYYPAHYGNSEEVFLSERPENHSASRHRFKHIKSVIVETMGNGFTVFKDVNDQ